MYIRHISVIKSCFLISSRHEFPFSFVPKISSILTPRLLDLFPGIVAILDRQVSRRALDGTGRIFKVSLRWRRRVRKCRFPDKPIRFDYSPRRCINIRFLFEIEVLKFYGITTINFSPLLFLRSYCHFYFCFSLVFSFLFFYSMLHLRASPRVLSFYGSVILYYEIVLYYMACNIQKYLVWYECRVVRKKIAYDKDNLYFSFFHLFLLYYAYNVLSYFLY